MSKNTRIVTVEKGKEKLIKEVFNTPRDLYLHLAGVVKKHQGFISRNDDADFKAIGYYVSYISQGMSIYEYNCILISDLIGGLDISEDLADKNAFIDFFDKIIRTADASYGVVLSKQEKFNAYKYLKIAK